MIDDRLAYTVYHELAGAFMFVATGVRLQVLGFRGLCVTGFTTIGDPHRSVFDWHGHLVRETPDGFVWFYPDWGTNLTFRVITLRRWKREVRPKLVRDWFGYLPDFDDEAEMHEWFRRKFCPYAVFIGRQKPDGTPVDES